MAKDITVLIVDDDIDIRQYVSTVLTNTTRVVLHECPDGESALAFCAETPPDLVLLDILMPKKDGFSVAMALKRLRVPFIAMTSIVDNESIHRMIELGSFSFLAKPMSEAQLLGTVESALAHIQQIEALREFASTSGDIGTARGAISAYLSIHPDQAFDVIHELARDEHGKSKDIASTVNNFLSFIASANTKLHDQRNRRTKKRKPV